jgi:valyl-tRNA synthetase
MPFLTEEIWQRLTEGVPERPKSVALAAYPEYDVHQVDLEAERQVELLQSIITAARDLRAQMKLDRKVVPGTLYTTGEAALVAGQCGEAIRKLAGVELAVGAGPAPADGAARAHTAEFDLILSVDSAEAEARREKLAKELAQLEKAAGNARRQLANQEFLNKAPAPVVESIRQKLAQYEVQIAKLGESLQQV